MSSLNTGNMKGEDLGGMEQAIQKIRKSLNTVLSIECNNTSIQFIE